MLESRSQMEPHLGNVPAADIQQPELAAIPMNSMATPEPGEGQMAVERANGGDIQDAEAPININGQGSPSRSAAVNSHDYRIKVDFEFLWRLRKYLLLLAVLAVSVTYNAGLSPPGGFRMDNSLDHHGHPGDPLLPVKFFRRYEVFFYCNATAFAASLVLIILLLSRGVASKHVWLRSMQVTMILDLFSLMAAYAAGSCRALKSSIYILVLVCAVFLYVGMHIVVSIRLVPKWLKEKVQKMLDLILEKLQAMLHKMLSICHVPHIDGQRNCRNEEKEIEDARKFILMLATFAATITYQAGMSPPGGFWDVNSYGYRPATFILRKHNLLRFNIFICCNATSFVASLVTVILLLSTELGMHGIRTQALFVCVIADLLGLIGAYASGSCRDVATSLSVIVIIVVVLICVLILVMFLQSKTVTVWLDNAVKPRFDKLLSRMSWPREGWLSNVKRDDSQRTNQQDGSQGTQQQDTEHLSPDTEVEGNLSNLQSCSADSNVVSTGDVKSASASDLNSMEDVIPNTINQSHDRSVQAATEAVCSSSTDALATKEVPMYNMEVQSADSEVTIPMGPSSASDSGKSIQCILPSQGLVGQNAARGDLRIDVDDPTMEKSSEMRCLLPNSHGDSAEQPGQPMANHQNGAENGGEVILVETDSINNDQATQHREKNSDSSYKNPDDARLKKSRTYILLLAILAVSLTYQAGLNPPGSFWTSNATNHSAGDPILEDNYHKRYLAFFYFNATAFAASLVMIIMLLSRKMSNKVIKRRALQTVMITDLLALIGAFVVGSCREKTKSIYISLVIFSVAAYVYVHALVSRHFTHVIPAWWKECFAQRINYTQSKSPETDNELRDDNEKNFEHRRNFLFIIAILAATVTYQAGLNPPGGIWSDGNSKGGRPGNPVLQDSHPKRYDVFYYSNAVSFVSSVAVIVLLVNRESCEHGIKSYALRVCLVADLVGLLIAYSAGSCRKAKPVIYLIVIASAVLLCLVIQVLVLSSTQDALEGPLTWLRRWLLKIFHLETDSERLPGSSDGTNNESNTPGSVPQINEKKERKRQKYLMMLAVLSASIAYQAGLNPPGGFWPDDSTKNGYKAGNPVLKDIHSWRYMVFFVFNSISFMAAIAVVMLLLSKSVRKKKVPLQALHFIMILDLLALMTAYAAGSCRKFRTSIFVLVVVFCVVIYLMIVIILSSGIARWLRKKGNKDDLAM